MEDLSTHAFSHTQNEEGGWFLVRRDELWNTCVGVLFAVLNVYFSPVLSMKGGLKCNKSCMCNQQYHELFLTWSLCSNSLSMHKRSSFRSKSGLFTKFLEKGIFSQPHSSKGAIFVSMNRHVYPHITEVTSSGVLYWCKVEPFWDSLFYLEKLSLTKVFDGPITL